MKKIVFLAVILLAFGVATSFAEMEASVSGSASVTLGINLNDIGGADGDEMGIGFANAGTSSATLTLSEGTSEKGAEEAVYGYIKVADWKVALTDAATSGAAGTVTAKIMADPIYVQIWALDDLATGKATIIDTSGGGAQADISDNLTESGGITIGYSGPITLAIHLASGDGYDTSAGDGMSNWAAGVDASIAAGPATIAVELTKAIGDLDANATNVGASVALDLGPLDPTVAFDMMMADGVDMMWEAGVVVDFDLGNSSKIDLDLSYSDSAYFDVKLGVTEDADAGFVPGLGVGITFLLADLGIAEADGEMFWDADVTFSFAISDTMKIGGAFGYHSNTTMNAEAYLEMKMITNTTMTLKFASASLSDATAEGGSAQDKGTITFVTSIAL
jgi:hypothetical protein